MYKSTDISIIIPTYNRAKYLEKNLSYLIKQNSKAKEILIIDQSKDNLTKKVYAKYKNKIKNLKYYHYNKPSIAQAKNLGLKKVLKKSKILLFLDDDAYVGKTYLNEIIEGYNDHPDAFGISGLHPITIKTNSFKFNIWNTYKKIFLLGSLTNKKLLFNAPYNNKGWLDHNKMYKAEWFSGTNPSFKKLVFSKLRFDDNFFGWSLGEDIDISYRIYREFGQLYTIPSSLRHEHPPAQYDLKKALFRIYMNQINHFYLYYKLMPNKTLEFFWNLFGIALYRILSLFNVWKIKKNYYESKHFFISLFYCLKNKRKIRRGDLSIPEFKI